MRTQRKKHGRIWLFSWKKWRAVRCVAHLIVHEIQVAMSHSILTISLTNSLQFRVRCAELYLWGWKMINGTCNGKLYHSTINSKRWLKIKTPIYKLFWILEMPFSCLSKWTLLRSKGGFEREALICRVWQRFLADSWYTMGTWWSLIPSPCPPSRKFTVSSSTTVWW